MRKFILGFILTFVAGYSYSAALPTRTLTNTHTPTFTNTDTLTFTETFTGTDTHTPTFTRTFTNTKTPTKTRTPLTYVPGPASEDTLKKLLDGLVPSKTPTPSPTALTTTPTPVFTHTMTGTRGADLTTTPSHTPTLTSTALTSTPTMTKTWTPIPDSAKLDAINTRLAGGINNTHTSTPTPTGTWSWPTATLTPTEIYPPAVQTKVAQIYSVALAQSTAIIADALAKQAAVWTAQPSGKPEFIPLNPTVTLTPTWVPSMTPSPTLTPTEIFVQNHQGFSLYTSSVGGWGDGGTKYGPKITLDYVPERVLLSIGQIPNGIGTGVVAYNYSSSPNFDVSGAVIATPGRAYVMEAPAQYWRVYVVDTTPTPAATPSPIVFTIQTKN